MDSTCRTCLWLRQEYYLSTKGGKERMVTAPYCGLFDVFRPLNGFCDMWEENNASS